MKFKEHKEKKLKRDGNGKYVTTHDELKGFTKQVENKSFGDKHFEKAYSRFKAPAYGMKGE
jgi:hypothetical protein